MPPTKVVLIRSVTETDVKCLNLLLEGNGTSVKLCSARIRKELFSFFKISNYVID